MDKYVDMIREEALKDSSLFWDIPQKEVRLLSPFALIERFLNYGDMDKFRKITKDKDSFKKLYSEIKQKERNNLSPIVINYVDLYLEKNA
jgi:hypothetical protein